MRLKQASIRQMEYFVTVARSPNFRKAAEKLQISQPTLTSQIAALEEVIGIQLFERSRAGTLLSPSGRELLPLARNTLEHYQQFIHYADNKQKEVSGVFKLGVSSTLGPYLLPRILPELRDLYPKLKLHIREASSTALESGLAAGNFDLILTVLPLNSVQNQVRPLFIEPFDLVLPAEHPLAQKTMVRLSDLEHQEVLAVEDEHLQRQVANVCERSGAQLHKAYEGNSLSTLEQMVMMGLGLAILPALFVRTEITAKTSSLVVMPFGNEIPGRTHVAAWRRNAPGRQFFQKMSYDIKVLSLDMFSHVLDEVNTEEGSLFSE